MQDETVGTALERHSSSSIPHCGVARSLAKLEPRAEAVEGWAVFVFPQALVQASEALIKPTRFDCLRGGRSLSLGALPDRRQCRGHVFRSSADKRFVSPCPIFRRRYMYMLRDFFPKICDAAGSINVNTDGLFLLALQESEGPT